MKIKINFGGSHRKNQKCITLLRPFMVRDALVMRTGLGSKRMETIVYDSPKLRKLLKLIGGSVSRHQPFWLNEEGTKRLKPPLCRAIQQDRLNEEDAP